LYIYILLILSAGESRSEASNDGRIAPNLGRFKSFFIFVPGESRSEASNATGEIAPNLGFRDLQGAKILTSPPYTDFA
jgi:hypothetical protein